MIRDNIQGKSFKKNYGFFLNCDLKCFRTLTTLGENSKAYWYSKSYTKELIKIIQNRIKVLT